jgi:hypothetical protein
MPLEYSPSSKESEEDKVVSCDFFNGDEAKQRAGEETAPLGVSAHGGTEARGEGGALCFHIGGGVRVQAEGACHALREAGGHRPRRQLSPSPPRPEALVGLPRA